ncbi:MAG TPA: SPOR domain-containing protein [Pyrinomonadaceae bacterium]|nr:SPOR domain-containing protein [Pyrinomonadaceae bacterium]
MNYEFSLTKTAVFSLIAGSIVIGILMFGAGLVVGAQWLTTSAASHDAVAQNDQADVPKEPVLNEEEAPAPKAKKVNPAADVVPAAPAAPKQSAPAAPQVTAPQPPAAAAQAMNAANGGGIQIIQEAAADGAADAAESEPDFVTVQVGVFLDQNEANGLLKDLESKGYSPSFFSGRDAEARQWYAVRIGAYSDRQQAANAASNFTRQEKRKAVVRPLGSL